MSETTLETTPETIPEIIIKMTVIIIPKDLTKISKINQYHIDKDKITIMIILAMKLLMLMLLMIIIIIIIKDVDHHHLTKEMIAIIIQNHNNILDRSIKLQLKKIHNMDQIDINAVRIE